MQTKRIRLWCKNYTLVSAPFIGRFFHQSQCSFFLFFLFRQLCLYISNSLHFFILFLTNSLKKCQTKSFENEYSTFCNISSDIKSQIVQQIKDAPSGLFAIQLDESTDVSSCAQLMVFVKYIYNDAFKEEFLFCSSLETKAKAEHIFENVSFFLI